jgi:hypothetical protein
MKLVSGQLISGADIAAGIFAIAVFAAWAAMAVVAVRALRRTGNGGIKGALWGGTLILSGVLLTVLLFERPLMRDLGVERRAIEARASELLARAIAPGSALTCLDAIGSVQVEAACEKALFATPEAVTAALAYVNAQYSLLTASAAFAERDPSYQPAVERLRRGLEEDRFGLVAQVLATRGCNAPDCADFAVLRDSKRIVANMKNHTFAAHVDVHAASWTGGEASSALAAASSSVRLRPPSGTEAGSGGAPATPGAPGRVRYEYPSAASFPPVHIMEAETDTPPLADPRLLQQKRPPSRPQAARDPAPAGQPVWPQSQVQTQAQPQTQASGSR